MKKWIAAALIQLIVATAWGQGEDKRIPIAIPDFSVLSKEVKDSEALAIQELLANALSNEPIFEVLERKQVTEIFNEVAFQVMTPGAMDSGVSQKLMGARALLIGSVGRLYGRTVITTRLVDLESGLVLFANNIYADDAEIASSIAALVNAIRDKGFEMTLRPTEEDVAKQVKAKNFGEAKKLADIYFRSHPDSAAVRAAYPAIIAGLADEYFRQAKSQLSKRLFEDARSRINQALALKVDERFYALREKIGVDEEDWGFRQAVLEARRKDELERRASGVSTGWDGVGSWYDGLDADGAHIGAVYAPALDASALSVDLSRGVWGGEAFWLKAVGKEADGKAAINWMAYLGASAIYEPGGSGAAITATAYLSPLFAQSARLGNVVLTLGLDGGGAFRYGGEPAPSGERWSAAFSGGGMACVSIKAWRSLGLYVAAKADYRYFPEDAARNGPALRLSSGLSF